MENVDLTNFIKYAEHEINFQLPIIKSEFEKMLKKIRTIPKRFLGVM